MAAEHLTTAIGLCGCNVSCDDMLFPRIFVDVSGETMKSAVSIGRYFLEHAKAAYSLMGADTVNKNAEYLLEAIKRNQLTEFSRRDAMRLRRRFKTADSLQPILTRLCEYGYIAPKPADTPNVYGRKPSEVYLTNPVVLECEGAGGVKCTPSFEQDNQT